MPEGIEGLAAAFRDTISLVRDAFLRRSPGTCTCTSKDAERKCMCCTAKTTSPRPSSCSQSRLRFCLRAFGGKSSVRKEVRCPPIQTRLCKHSGNESNNPNQKTKMATSYICIVTITIVTHPSPSPSLSPTSSVARTSST